MTQFTESELSAISTALANRITDAEGNPLTGYDRFRMIESLMPQVTMALEIGMPVMRAKILRELRAELPKDNFEIDFALATLEDKSSTDEI